MERLFRNRALLVEQERINTDLMSLVSRMSWRGAPDLSAFPNLVSVNNQIVVVIDEVWGRSTTLGGEYTSTVFTTLAGDIRSTRMRGGSFRTVMPDKLVSSWQGRFFTPRVNVHTHLEPSPPSLGDLVYLLRKRGVYGVIGYLPAIVVVNEKAIWAALRSAKTPPISEEAFWRIDMGIDHRVTNNALWQNEELYQFAAEYQIALYQGTNRDSRSLVRVPRFN